MMPLYDLKAVTTPSEMLSYEQDIWGVTDWGRVELHNPKRWAATLVDAEGDALHLSVIAHKEGLTLAVSAGYWSQGNGEFVSYADSDSEIEGNYFKPIEDIDGCLDEFNSVITYIIHNGNLPDLTGYTKTPA